MEIGIDSFAAAFTDDSRAVNASDRLRNLIEQIEHAAFRRGLLMLSCGDDAIRVSPPLVFREDQAREALRIFEEVIAEVESLGT